MLPHFSVLSVRSFKVERCFEVYQGYLEYSCLCLSAGEILGLVSVEILNVVIYF